MALPLDVEAAYTKIIDSILAESNLNTISEKRIRKRLQASVDHDISPRKAEVVQLILTRFDKAIEQKGLAAAAEGDGDDGAQSNGHAATSESPASPDKTKSPSSSSKHKREHDAVDDVEEPASATPVKRKKQDLIDEDAIFAAKLQAEENSRARPTRAGTTRRKPPTNKKKSSAKKKSSNKVNSDDSDAQSGSDDGKDEKKVNRSGGFHKPLLLSPALSELVGGETSMSRPQIVKNVWAHIKEHGLQDPNDKRQICCDDAMRAVFKQDRVHMFTMNKIINQNVYAMDE